MTWEMRADPQEQRAHDTRYQATARTSSAPPASRKSNSLRIVSIALPRIVEVKKHDIGMADAKTCSRHPFKDGHASRNGQLRIQGAQEQTKGATARGQYVANTVSPTFVVVTSRQS